MNLDLEAQRFAQAVATEAKSKKEKWATVENVVTKALGVLQESGVYAAVLFLETRSKQDQITAAIVENELRRLTEKLLPETSGGKKVEFPVYLSQHVTTGLDRLLLVKQVWEQALIYTRYGAKAEKNREPKQTQEAR